MYNKQEDDRESLDGQRRPGLWKEMASEQCNGVAKRSIAVGLDWSTSSSSLLVLRLAGSDCVLVVLSQSRVVF